MADKDNSPALFRTLQGHNNIIETIAFNPNTTEICSASNDNYLYLWRLKQKNIRAKKIRGHSAPINEVAYSPSGALIATASKDNTVRIWQNHNSDVFTNHIIRSHSACVKTVCFSPDSRLLASGSDDKVVKVFNVSFNNLLVTH